MRRTRRKVERVRIEHVGYVVFVRPAVRRIRQKLFSVEREPVAVFVTFRHQPVFGVIFPRRQILFHGLVIVRQKRTVAVHFIKRPRDHDRRIAPHGARPRIFQYVGHDVRHFAVVPLVVTQIG